MSTALVGNKSRLESSLGFGEVGRAVQLMLVDGLAAALAREKDRWDAADLEYQAIFGGPGETDLDPVLASHIHSGPHESLLKQPASAFPAISVMAYYTQPVAQDPFDHIVKSTVRVAIEVMCISTPYETDVPSLDLETVLHRKIERTTEAVHDVIWSDKTLRGTAHPGISERPRGGIGNQAPVKREAGGAGARRLMQGGKLEYLAQRQTSFN